MKEIVIISGKGGTGKTSLSASFAYLEKEDAIVADCDVDAANMHLLLDADFGTSEEFFSGENAIIKEEDCTNCGVCASVCRFGAISFIEDNYKVDPLACEGCWYCSRVCPRETIQMQKQKSGDLFVSHIKSNSLMVHAKLGFAAENSGKLVAHVKNSAKKIAIEQEKKFVIVDGSPGIGCPVVSSLSGANLVVLVTEATVSGLHDLKRIHQVVKKFGIKSVCIINKYDLNDELTQKIKEYLTKENIKLIVKLPYNEDFTKAMSKAQCIVENENSQLTAILKDSWKTIKDEIQ
jgi:MinD superfamily P-loop ATPase